MIEPLGAQLKLRRVFRYASFAFLTAFLALLIMFSLSVMSGSSGSFLRSSLSTSSDTLLIAMTLGLSVPLFCAFWSLVGTALLGAGRNRRSLLDGMGD